MAQQIHERKERRGVVENKLFGKSIRTFAFILIAVGAAIVAVTTIIALRDALGGSASNYDQYVEAMENALSKIGVPNLIFYAQAMLLVGFLLLVLAIGKSWFGKTLHIIVFIFLAAYLVFKPEHSILLLIGEGQAPDAIKNFALQNADTFNKFDNLIASYPKLMGGIVTALYVIITTSVIGKKRPRRFSLGLINAGFGLVMFMVLVAGILLPILATHVELVKDVMAMNYYFIAVYGALVLSLILQLIGSVIGTIFFFLK